MSAAPDEVTSLSATGLASAGAIAFTTTHWSVVLEDRSIGMPACRHLGDKESLGAGGDV
ncbi:MAG TPA: hypothetical protein VN801_08065 [Candidatus Udaeobacter sp.]|nr:hypothetical protein [Candidatus Udaeobacter sp.]